MVRQALIGLVVIAVAVLGVFVFNTPRLQTPTANELSVAKRVCDSVNKIMGNTAYEGNPLTASDCIPSNQYCEQKWGVNAVWAGSSDENGAPICSCDDGYIWHNDDGTIGTSYGTNKSYDFISAPGRCVRQ